MTPSIKYIEFSTYFDLLMGSSPLVLQHSSVARHRQTWKLREYHFHAPDYSQDGSNIDATPNPMPPGDPLRAHIPAGTRFREFSNNMEMTGPLGTFYYRRTAGVVSS